MAGRKKAPTRSVEIDYQKQALVGDVVFADVAKLSQIILQPLY